MSIKNCDEAIVRVRQIEKELEAWAEAMERDTAFGMRPPEPQEVEDLENEQNMLCEQWAIRLCHNCRGVLLETETGMCGECLTAEEHWQDDQFSHGEAANARRNVGILDGENVAENLSGNNCK